MEYLGTYFVLQVVFMFGIHAQDTSIKYVCKANRPGQCYTLYKNTAGPLTWTQAQQLCITYNETLATLPDLDTQQTLEKLIDTGSNTGAWLAGQVRTDDRWQLLNGEIYNKAPKESASSNDNCGYLLVLDTVTEFYSTSCLQHKDTLCQYPSTEAGCEAGDIHVGTSCLRRINNGDTWYSAVTTCRNLGYSLTRYEPGLLNLNKTYLTKGNIWLQVYRYPWIWNTGSDKGIIKYFSWDVESGNNIPGYCMYMSDNNGKWKTQLCDSTTDVSYFVCEKDITTTTTSTTSTTTTTTTTITTTTTPATTTTTIASTTESTTHVPAVNKTAGSGQSKGLPDYIIILAVVAGLVCLIILVVVVLLCQRRTKRKGGRRSTSASASGTLTSTKRSLSKTTISENQGENNRVRPGYVYYNDSYEWTEVKKDLPNNGEVAPENTTTLSTTTTKTAPSSTNYDQLSTDDPERTLSWSELCNMYVGNEGEKKQKGHGKDKKAKRAKEGKGVAPKDNQVNSDGRVNDDGHLTGNKFMYGWSGTGNGDTRGEHRGNDNPERTTNYVDDADNVYAKVDKKRSSDK